MDIEQFDEAFSDSDSHTRLDWKSLHWLLASILTNPSPAGFCTA